MMQRLSPSGSLCITHDRLLSSPTVNLSSSPCIPLSKDSITLAPLSKVSSEPKTGHAIYLTAFLVLFLLYLATAFATRILRLRNVPGPALAAYTRLWLAKTLASGNSAKTFVEINKEYGKL